MIPEKQVRMTEGPKRMEMGVGFKNSSKNVEAFFYGPTSSSHSIPS